MVRAQQQNSLADEQQVNLSWVNQIDVGQRVHPLQTRMDPTVQLAITHTQTGYSHTPLRLNPPMTSSYHNFSPFELEDDAGPSDFLPRSPVTHKHTLIIYPV